MIIDILCCMFARTVLGSTKEIKITTRVGVVGAKLVRGVVSILI
jgi:hypothetical protein